MLLLLLVMATCMGAGYGQSDFPQKETPPAPAAPADDSPEDSGDSDIVDLPPRPVTLGLGLIKGKSYTYESWIYTQNTVVSVTPDIPMPSEMPGNEMTITTKMMVADDTAEDYTVTQVIERFDMDSGADMPPQVQDNLDALTGAEITFVLSPAGDIKSLAGMDALWDRLAEAACDDPVSLNIANMLKQTLNDEKLKEQMGRMFGARPQGLIEPGSTWDTSVPMEISPGNPAILNLINSFDGLVRVDGVEAVVLSGYADQEFPGGMAVMPDVIQQMAPGMDMKIFIDYLGMDTVSYLRSDTSEIIYLSTEVTIEMRTQVTDPDSGQEIEIVMDVNVSTEVSPVE